MQNIIEGKDVTNEEITLKKCLCLIEMISALAA